MARAAQIDNSTIARAKRANGTANAGGDGGTRDVAVALAPLIAPYKKQGRLSLRIERLPQLARFSRGSKNNDGSWSLAPDELEDLIYQIPDSVSGEHVLTVRIIGLAAGSTLAVVEFPVSADVSASASPSAPAPEPAAKTVAPAQTVAHDDAQLKALHDEMKKMRAEFGSRDSDLSDARKRAERAEAELSESRKAMERAVTELADAQKKAEQATTQASKHDSKAEVAAARAAWESELKVKLAAVAIEAAAKLQQARDTWESEQRAQLAKAEAHTKELVATARVAGEREAKDALAKAEAAWKAAEAEHRASLDAEWQKKLAKALADERAENDKSRTQSQDGALSELREKLSALQASVAERDVKLAESAKAADAERANLQREMQDALGQAEQRWKADEATRLAAAEAAWQKKFAGAAAEVRTQGDSMRDQEHERELSALRDQLTALQATLAERDAALSAVKAAQETGERQRKDAQEALAKAEAAWKAGEAERLAAAEAKWRAETAKAVADARQQSAAEPEEETEFKALREKLASLQSLLADREGTLARADKAMEAAHLRWQKDAQQAIAKSLRDRKADETARVAAAESQARKQMAKELADATARYEAAETALAKLRLNTKDDSRLQNELAALRASLTARESELAHARSVISHHDDKDPQSSHAHGHGVVDHQPPRLMDKRRLMRDAGIAACVGVVGVALYPMISSAMFRAPPQPKPIVVAEAAPTPVVEPRRAVVVRYARMRDEPSKTGAVVAALTIGSEVAIIESNERWAHVRVAGDGTSKPREGWVSTAQIEEKAVAKSVPALRSE